MSLPMDLSPPTLGEHVTTKSTSEMGGGGRNEEVGSCCTRYCHIIVINQFLTIIKKRFVDRVQRLPYGNRRVLFILFAWRIANFSVGSRHQFTRRLDRLQVPQRGREIVQWRWSWNALLQRAGRFRIGNINVTLNRRLSTQFRFQILLPLFGPVDQVLSQHNGKSVDDDNSKNKHSDM